MLGNQGVIILKTVFSIFKGDVKSLLRRFFATIVAIAISVLPALYAWVNIYANSNPYVNTSGIKIAVASDDEGIDLDDGTHVNSAESVIEDNLKNSTSIGWQFPKTSAEAIEGVESGEYYAAIIFNDNFTYNMYHLDYALSNDDAPVTFYRNDKKNAVASKITDTAASNVLEAINTEYLRVLFEEVFGYANDLGDTLNSVDAVNAAIDKLTAIRDNLDTYNAVVGSFVSNSSNLAGSIDSTQKNIKKGVSNGRKTVSQAQTNIENAISQIESMKTALEGAASDIVTYIEDLNQAIEDFRNATSTNRDALAERVVERADSLITRLQALKEVVDTAGDTPGAQAASAAIDAMITQTETIKQIVQNTPDRIESLQNAIKTITSLGKDLKADLDEMADSMKSIVQNLYPLADSILTTVESVDPVLGATKGTVNSLDKSMKQLQVVLGEASDGLTSLIDRLNNSDIDEQIQILIDFLGGDPDRYAQFFSSLIDVQVEEVYPVANYGAAMAPFYSTLAIWVGGVILVAILKTHIAREKYPNATDKQAFFGRFILFYILGQVQALVIALGDIYLLGCNPVHPVAFWFAASVASFVFTLLIYSLTRTFGDVGKAIVVVTMVVQIAGSSGSYPIEILPVIFSKIYKFFPFPYAINAMREALCGMYGMDYWIYLGELMLFAIAALAIGLLARRSFIGINEFVSEKIEETEVL